MERIEVSDGRELILLQRDELRGPASGMLSARAATCFVTADVDANAIGEYVRQVEGLLTGHACGFAVICGEHAERVHDELDSALEMREGETSVVTSWFRREELEDALDVFWNGLGASGRGGLIAIVGSQDDHVRARIRAM
ncbi:hypothetical protein [Corallococcus aberystwythensis]|uniref:hypothetical protein n=1 Tax=Corallococcus aberystwythensis TaxID=2316722 RepID=UPI0011C37CE9|nr:hypothetical protein [Corallococcus aberystwythensis]